VLTPAGDESRQKCDKKLDDPLGPQLEDQHWRSNGFERAIDGLLKGVAALSRDDG
jgi:hypothetical protein